MPSTIRLHRVLRAPPEKVYRAFTDGDAMAKWIAPHGFVCKVHAFDAKVGGSFRMSFMNFTTQKAESFGGTFLELQPNARLRYNDVFDDPNLPGEMIVTVELTPAFCGCELHITQEGVPDVIPPAACYLGWQDSLLQLANLVEPNIDQ